MKSNRSLIIFLMVFVVVAVLVAIQNMQPRVVAGPTPTPPDPQTFTDFTLNDIQAIRLRSPESNLTFDLARDANGLWTAPNATGTLNTTEANNIAKTMVLLPYSQTLTLKAGDDKKTYGFTPEGILVIEIVLQTGVTHAVEVGYRTPTQENYYALVDDRPDLYLLDRAPIDYLISRLKTPPVS